MADREEINEIFSKRVRAGRRTYFFDVQSTKAEDYYMTISESIKDTNNEGISSYRKHKIYLYKEDFNNFKMAFESVSNYIIAEKGEKIISSNKFEEKKELAPQKLAIKPSNKFTEINFDDLGKD